MSEWWTYRPADFLMFAPQTYWRLFELHNHAVWPAQPLLVAAALAWLLWLARSASALALRIGLAGLAAVWAGVAWAFLLERYAPINWAATAFAAGWFVQALGLAALACSAGLSVAAAGPRRRVGLLLFGWAICGHPLLALVAGRPATQAEFFGFAPDPSAVATLGLLLCAGAAPGGVAGMLRSALWALAWTWCAISAATLWTMGSGQGWVLLAAALAAAAGWRAGRSAS